MKAPLPKIRENGTASVKVRLEASLKGTVSLIWVGALFGTAVARTKTVR